VSELCNIVLYYIKLEFGYVPRSSQNCWDQRAVLMPTKTRVRQ